jgi:hypothetical protein
MTEADWWECQDSEPMLGFLDDKMVNGGRV